MKNTSHVHSTTNTTPTHQQHHTTPQPRLSTIGVSHNMINLLSQVGQQLSGNSRKLVSTPVTNSNQKALETEVGLDFIDSDNDNEDDSQKHLKSPHFTNEKKKKKVQFGDPLAIIAEAAKGIKLGDESSDSRENSSEINKEASVPGFKRRKLINGTSKKTKLGKTPRIRKVPGSGNDKEKNENTNKNTND